MEEQHKQAVYVVVGDLGAFRELFKPMLRLQDLGVSVQWFCDPKGKAAQTLQKNNISFLTREPTLQDNPQVIVCGTSAIAYELQYAWTNWATVRPLNAMLAVQFSKKAIPVLWYEDIYGTGERDVGLSARPTVMMVIDEMAKEIALKVRPRLDVRIVGKPTFENVPGLMEHKAEIRNHIRTQYGVSDNEFLMMCAFGGDPPARAREQFAQILENRIALPKNIRVAWRFHQKQPDRDSLWEIAAASGIPFIDAREEPLDELQLACDLVVANWGNNDPYKGILCGIPVITMLFPDDTDVRVKAGYPDGVPPIVQEDRRWGVESIRELLHMLSYVHENPQETSAYTLKVRARPFQNLALPGACERIVDVVREFLRY